MSLCISSKLIINDIPTYSVINYILLPIICPFGYLMTLAIDNTPLSQTPLGETIFLVLAVLLFIFINISIFYIVLTELSFKFNTLPSKSTVIYTTIVYGLTLLSSILLLVINILIKKYY